MSKIKVLDHGSVELVNFCAEDLDVVNAAKVSLNTEADFMGEREIGILKFLVKKRHGTPFEHNYFKFRVKAPLFVFREWHRHRVGHSYNEWSARYSKLDPEFYIPEEITTQVGKPGAYTFELLPEDEQKIAKHYLEASYGESYATYEHLLGKGVAKQQARMVLPVATYSEMIWSCNARSIMHFLSLRAAPDAQMEIRLYAEAVASLFETVMPITYQAFVENGLKAP